MKIRRQPRCTQSKTSAATDVCKRQTSKHTSKPQHTNTPQQTNTPQHTNSPHPTSPHPTSRNGTTQLDRPQHPACRSMQPPSTIQPTHTTPRNNPTQPCQYQAFDYDGSPLGGPRLASTVGSTTGLKFALCSRHRAKQLRPASLTLI